MSVQTYEGEVRDTIRSIQYAGFELIKVDYERGYGTEEGVDMVCCLHGNVAMATEAVLAVDDSHLFIKTPKGDEVWVYFVLGNEPGEVVNDYSIPPDKDEAELLETCIGDVANEWEPE